MLSQIELDTLYHLLRAVSNDKDRVQYNAIRGLTNHLLSVGDYSGLNCFLEFYGTNFLSPSLAGITKDFVVSCERIIDLGSGNNWLAKDLTKSLHLAKDPLMFDKRPWTPEVILADIETVEGREKVLQYLVDGDVIVGCNLLHCLDNPEGCLQAFYSWPIFLAEYYPSSIESAASLKIQLRRYGAIGPLVLPGADQVLDVGSYLISVKLP